MKSHDDTPAPTKITLRPYQTNIVCQGTAIIQKYGLLLLFLQTRTGKTLISLSIADRIQARQVLFITKKKAISSIRDDYNQSGYSFALDVLSVDSAHKAISKYDLIILDESHSCGAYPRPSLRAKRLRGVVKSTPLILLSATPTPESWSMLFHQIFISSRSPYREYKNFYAWARDYVTVKERRFNGVVIRDYSKADAPRIQAELAPYIITLTQAEAGFNQVVNEYFLEVSMPRTIHKLIELLLKNRLYTMRDGSEIVCDSAVKLMSKCHQIASGSVITENGNHHILDESKATAIRDKFTGKKIAIFYKFIAEKELLCKYFPTWTNDPDIFREVKDTVFLGQFVSAREGLELSAADCIVFYNIDFAYLSYAQSRERLQKLDRLTIPELWWVFGDTGMEQKIYKVVSKKRNFTAKWFKKDWL